MGTLGKHWERRDIKWKREIQEWLASRCPVREHGYKTRKEVLDDLNATFGTDFHMNAFVTHCYESGIQLGLVSSNSGIARGERHWRHRSVGDFQVKKGYVRIKVAEPNVWMQYQRYVWEKAHPGESAEGMAVIFMDGNTRNFDPSNLERVTRAEQSVMAEFGNTKEMTRDERYACLLRARIALAKGNLVGKEEAAAMHRKAYYQRVKDTPEFKAKCAASAHRRYERIMADPDRRMRYLEKMREYRKKNPERVKEWARKQRSKKWDT